jgi:hypothetical protein
MVCCGEGLDMLSFTQKKDILNYFKQNNYEVEEISDNIIDIMKKNPKFYLQIIIDDDIKVSRLSIRTEDFYFEFDNYYNRLKMSAKFSIGEEVELQYQHPFLAMDIDMEKYKLMPISYLVIDLLSQAPIASELIRDVYNITQHLDELIKEEGN